MSGLVAFLLRFRNKTTCKKRKIKAIRRMRCRNESSVVRRHSKTTVDLTRNSDNTSIQQTDHDPTKDMCLTELSPTNWLFEDAGVPEAAVYNIDFGLGVRTNSSKNSSTEFQNQLMCPKQEIRLELQKQLDQKRDKQILDEKRQELQDQFDKMRGEMENQAQRAIKQLVEENRERDEKRDEQILGEKRQELQEQFDKMRDEMKNQTQRTIKQLVEDNREGDEKRDVQILDEKRKELQEQFDKLRNEMNNQTQRTIKQLVDENRESLREIRREMKRINRRL